MSDSATGDAWRVSPFPDTSRQRWDFRCETVLAIVFAAVLFVALSEAMADGAVMIR